jgi:hypothetical protein
MINLKGSEKQIIWADKIRNSVVALFNFEIERISEIYARYTDSEEIEARQKTIDRMKKNLDKILQVSSAEFFIDYFKFYTDAVAGFPVSERCVYSAGNIADSIYDQYE